MRDLTLNRCIDVCRSEEVAELQMKSLSGPVDNINQVKSSSKKPRAPKPVDGGVWKSRNPESGTRNRNRNANRNLNWDRGKLGSTETSSDCSRHPCGNKIQDGILCYHCFEKSSAQWSWYQRHTHIRKVTCKKKGKCILLLFLAVINCDCSCRSSNFRQIETTTNQKPIACENQPLLVCDD